MLDWTKKKCCYSLCWTEWQNEVGCISIHLHRSSFPVLTSVVPFVWEFCGNRAFWSPKTIGIWRCRKLLLGGNALATKTDRFLKVCVSYKRGWQEREVKLERERDRENKTIPISVITWLKSFYHHILVNFLQYLLSFKIDFWALHSI
jgi:hypothetical protein